MTDIDREVAEKVMGWTTIRVGYMGTDDETPEQREHQEWLDENNVWSVGSYYCDFPGGQWRYADGYEPWSPSTRIDHVWEVVEKLRKQWEVELSGAGPWDGMPESAWYCAIDDEPLSYADPDSHVGYAEAETAPLAICKAALAALEVL